MNLPELNEDGSCFEYKGKTFEVFKDGDVPKVKVLGKTFRVNKGGVFPKAALRYIDDSDTPARGKLFSFQGGKKGQKRKSLSELKAELSPEEISEIEGDAAGLYLLYIGAADAVLEKVTEGRIKCSQTSEIMQSGTAAIRDCLIYYKLNTSPLLRLVAAAMAPIALGAYLAGEKSNGDSPQAAQHQPASVDSIEDAMGTAIGSDR